MKNYSETVRENRIKEERKRKLRAIAIYLMLAILGFILAHLVMSIIWSGVLGNALYDPNLISH